MINPALSWPNEDVEDDGLAEELQHRLHHRLDDVDEPPVDLVIPAPVRAVGQAEQDAAHGPVLRVDAQQGQHGGRQPGQVARVNL